MRGKIGLSRSLLQKMQFLFFCTLCAYFTFHLSFTSEEISVLKRRALSSGDIYLGEELAGNSDKENFSSRFATVRPPNITDEDLQKENNTFLPFGPDENAPGKPAVVPTVFPIEESDFCQKNSNLDIIAYVHSSINRFTARDITRATWANATAQNLGVNIGVVFMVGRPKNEKEARILKEESDRYHDIVQGDYADHYRLLSYKGLAALHWINKHCSHVKWIMHSDDDVHIDIFLYWQKIKDLSEDVKEKFICSHMYGPALRSGRWYVSYEQYPKRDYPLYCSGGLWFLQTKKLPLLLEASKTVPFLWVDDAYLTGLLAIEAGIERHPFQEFYGHPKPQLDDIGKKVAWFFLHQSRLEVWNKVVEYHKTQTANAIVVQS